MASSETLLAAVERLPGVRLEIDDARRSAGVHVAARLVAHSRRSAGACRSSD
jgi:hypothetical protein